MGRERDSDLFEAITAAGKASEELEAAIKDMNEAVETLKDYAMVAWLESCVWDLIRIKTSMQNKIAEWEKEKKGINSKLKKWQEGGENHDT